MSLLETYSVQRLLDDGTVTVESTRTVEATSPLLAGEQVLREALALNGRRPKVLVRWMRENFVPRSVKLYEPLAALGTPAII